MSCVRTISRQHLLVLGFDHLEFSIVDSVKLSDLLVVDHLSPVYIVSGPLVPHR